MKLLVTGSESFVGRELSARCRGAGIDPIGLDSRAGSRTAIVRDIRASDLSACMPTGLEAVVHLAAISRDGDCARDPRACYDINLTGTLNAFDAAHASGARQFVFASTEWVYDGFDPLTARMEDDPIDAARLRSHYALSKLVAESALRLRHLETGMPVTVLRFGIIYGPRRDNWSAVESLLAAVAGGGPVRVGSRATARGFVHVTDIADGILAAIGRGGYEIVNFQADAPISLGEIIDRSARLLGRDVVIEETEPDRPNVRNVSNARARALLGWRPRVDLCTGLRTVADFLELA